MSTETVNIIINESGAKTAKDDIHAIGPAALQAHAGVEQLNSGLEQLKSLLVAAGLSMGVHELIEVAERYDTLAQKLRLTATSAQDLADKEEALFAISQRTYQSFEGVTDTFLGLNKAVVGLGGSYKDTLQVTENVAKAMTISGKSAEDTKQALTRLSMALQTGHTDARVFMTLFRSMPELVAAVSSQLNMSAGEFQHALSTGAVSSKQLIEAMQHMGDAGTELARKFSALEVNIARAWTNLGNAVLRYVGQNDQALGTTHLLAMAIDLMAKNIHIVMPLVSALSAGIAVLGISMIATSGTFATFMAAIGANKWGLILAAVAAAASLFLSLSKSIQIGGADGASALAYLTAAFKTLQFAVMAVWNSAIRPFFDWLLGIDPAILTAGIIALAGAITVLGSIKILGWVLGLTSGFLGLLAAVLPTTIAIAAWVAGVVIATALVLKFTDAIGFTSDAYQKFSSFLEQGATKIKDKFTSSLKSASEDMKKNSLASKEWSGSFNVAAGSITGSLGKINGAADNSAAIMARDTKFIEANMKQYEQEMEFLATHVRNAFGDMIKIEDEWAARSGAYFNKVAKDAGGMAESVASSVSHAAGAIRDMDRSLADQIGDYGLAQQFGNPQLTTGPAEELKRQNATQKAAIDELAAKIDLMRTQDAISGVQQDAEADELDKQLAVMRAKNHLFEMDMIKQVNSMMSAASQWSFTAAILASVGGNPQNHFKVDQGLGNQAWGPDDYRSRTNGFASGTSFMVGGQGGSDSQLVQFMASPDERVDVLTPRQQKQGGRGGGSVFYVTVPINGVKDTSDWKRSEKQIVTSLLSKLSDAQRSFDRK